MVRVDEILHPGEKFFVVPCHTVRKLKKRIRKPSSKNPPADPFNVPQSSCNETRPRQKDEFSRNVRNTNTFVSASSGDHHKKVGNGGVMVEKKGKEGDNSRRRSIPQSHGRKKEIVRNSVTWQPSLTSICESLEN